MTMPKRAGAVQASSLAVLFMTWAPVVSGMSGSGWTWFFKGSAPQMLAEAEPTNFLFVGNPGTGKSTILNGLIGELTFQSGISYGEGMTYRFDQVKHGKHTFMDTPGLSDMKRREAAAEAITEALKQDGRYKIFFVITLQNGRVRPEDVTTMNLVLDAAPITHYAIIINQMPQREFEELKSDTSPASGHLARSLLATLPSDKAIPLICPVARDSALEGADNKVKPLPEALVKFIVQKTRGMEIRSQDVQQVRVNEWDEKVQGLEEQLSSVQANNQHLIRAQKDSEETNKALQTQLQRVQKDSEETRKELQAQVRRAQQDQEREAQGTRQLEQVVSSLEQQYRFMVQQLRKKSEESEKHMLASVAIGGLAALGFPAILPFVR
ncbi:unnamed protein product [Symbiodinium natans]|uniref:G domain-containing protein n=1 Tax=Symbiodinium natans TaxID=878477 RepID=A0A812SP67_9DINO|nr:unnamed protein product [Symbiodinium natans]